MSEPIIHRGDNMDAELDYPIHDARVAADLKEFQKRRMSKSPEQTVEALLRQHELNVKAAESQRWAGQERWQGKENEAMRLVRIMHVNSFIRKLDESGVRASIGEGRKHGVRIWLNDFVRVGRVGVNAWVIDPETEKRVGKTITTLQYPVGPEFSVMRFDEHNVPTNERYRGWRTALLALIFADIITEEEARKAFGAPSTAAGEFYLQQLYIRRNGHLPS